MNNEKIELSLETVNKVLGYLGTKPYQEVFALMDTISREAQLSMSVSDKEETDN